MKLMLGTTELADIDDFEATRILGFFKQPGQLYHLHVNALAPDFRVSVRDGDLIRCTLTRWDIGLQLRVEERL